MLQPRNSSMETVSTLLPCPGPWRNWTLQNQLLFYQWLLNKWSGFVNWPLNLFHNQHLIVFLQCSTGADVQRSISELCSASTFLILAIPWGEQQCKQDLNNQRGFRRFLLPFLWHSHPNKQQLHLSCYFSKQFFLGFVKALLVSPAPG